MSIQRADWVACRSCPGIVGIVTRMASDGTWADVNWPQGPKRMQTRVLVPQATTIQVATDLAQQGREEPVEAPVKCEACGTEYLPDAGYYDPGEYSYCSDCCKW